MMEYQGGTSGESDNSRGFSRKSDNNNTSTSLKEIDLHQQNALQDIARYDTVTSTSMSEHQSGTVLIRVAVPDLKLQKCLQFVLNESVWEAKEKLLSIFSKSLKDYLNYGFYMPPMNGRAGKFLEEERLLREYPLHEPIGFLEFKYKKRVYKVIHLNVRKLKQLHNKANFKEFINHVKNANLSKVNKLTNRGLDPNFHDSTGETPLTYAVTLPKSSCREMIMTLVSAGAHIDFRNRCGQTPMHAAVLSGNQTAVKTLLDLGASTNYKDSKGLTPLYYSVLYAKNASCAEMLLHERALIGFQDEQGWFEIHQACKQGLVQHLEHLLFYGADIDATNASGNTPLHICAVNNNEQCARILLFRGANKYITNFNNQIPQQVAIIAGNVSMAELINNFREQDVVPFRELPTFSNRRPRLSMNESTMSVMSRSHSEMKLNLSDVIGDNSSLTPPASMRSLPEHFQMYTDSVSYASSQRSDSLKSMSISSTSSGPVTSVADPDYWEKSVNSRDGWFPSHHVQKVRLRKKAGSVGDLLEGANIQYSTLNRNTLATLIKGDIWRPMLSLSTIPIKDEDGEPVTTTPVVKMVPPLLLGPSPKTVSMYASAPDLLRIEQVYGVTLPRGIGKELSRPALTSNYSPRTVVLQKASGGYGFVLRGTKSHTERNGELDFHPTAQIPALQFLESVDPGSAADRAGLRKGDYILEINGENVVRASHDRVVNLILSTGSQLVLKVVGVRQGSQSDDMSLQKEKFMTMSNTMKKVQAPAPLKRDPRTSLSMTRSEGHYIGEEMAVMDTLDEAIQGKKDGGDIKTASIHSRTAAKRVSVVDMHNIGIEMTKEMSKSTSDLVDENSKVKTAVIYATSVVPGEKSSNQKNISTVSHMNTTDAGIDTTSPTGTIRPKVPPPAPPGGILSPKKQAPKSPSDTTEVITVATGKLSPYALATSNTRSEKLESPYVTSFRPGASAKFTEDPIESNGYKQTDQHNTSAGALVVSNNRVVENDNPVSNTISSNSNEQNVFSVEDQVLDRAASFLKKHPKAKSLITREGLEKVKNRNSTYEPLPDYDSNIEDDEAFSTVKERQKDRQSVTMILIGDKSETLHKKRYTINSTVPSVDVHTNYSLPTKPQGPAPSPPSETLWQATKKSTVQHSPKQSQDITVTAEINMRPAIQSVASHETSAPLLSQTFYPDYNTQESSNNIVAKVSSAFREAPPPPLPPPPVPSVFDGPKLKAEVQVDYIPIVTQDAIAAAVAKRQERLEKEGLKMGAAQKPKEQVEIPVKDSTQAAILAAVAKRREQLKQQSTTSFVESIESRLQKTKKLQAAKFQIASTKTPKDGDNDIEKSNLSSPRKAISSASFNDIEKSDLPPLTRNAFSSVALNQSGENISKEPLKVNEKPAKEQTSSKPNMELSFQVKPLNVVKYQTGTKASKPAFNSKAITNYKPVNGVSGDSDKLKKQEYVKPKAEPSENGIASVMQTKMKIENKSTVNKVVYDGKNNNYLNGLSSDNDKSRKQEQLKPKAEQHDSDSDKLKKQEYVKPKAEPSENGIASVIQTKMKIENKSTVNEVVSDGKNNLNGLSNDNDKFKKQEHLKPKAEQVENSVASIGQTKKEIENKSSENKLVSDGKNDGNANVQSDFLALAEKKRLEFLQRKQKSSELKSSSASGSPEINRFHTQTENKQPVQKGFSPHSLIKPKQNGSGTNVNSALPSPQMYANVPQSPSGFRDGSMNPVMQLEIIPPPSNFSSQLGLDATQQHNLAFSPDTASLVSSLSTLSSQSGDQNDGHTNTFEDDTIAPPPPGFGDNDMAVIPPPPEFENENRIFANRSGKTFIDKPINDWMCNDVLDWLDSLNMSQYKLSFQSNCIDGKKLLTLTKNNYIDLGVAQVGHRMNIERSIKKAAIMQTGNANEIVTSEHL